MGKASSIKRLPPDLQEQVNRLLNSGHTLDEIKSALDELGAGVSRSALGRYKKSLAQVSDKIKHSREVAAALVESLGDAPENKTARLNIELLHSAILNLAMNTDDEDESGGGLSSKEAAMLAKALDHLARAAKADTEQTLKLREQLRKEEEAKMQAALAQASKDSKGQALSAEDVFKKIQAIYRGEA